MNKDSIISSAPESSSCSPLLWGKRIGELHGEKIFLITTVVALILSSLTHIEVLSEEVCDGKYVLGFGIIASGLSLSLQRQSKDHKAHTLALRLGIIFALSCVGMGAAFIEGALTSKQVAYGVMIASASYLGISILCYLYVKKKVNDELQPFLKQVDKQFVSTSAESRKRQAELLKKFSEENNQKCATAIEDAEEANKAFDEII